MKEDRKGIKGFSDRVRDARKLAGLTQKQLAKAAGLSQTTISDIERGRNDGSRELIALADALMVRAKWLQTGIINDAEADRVIAEFAWVYQRATDEGKAFLRNTVTAAKSAFVIKEKPDVITPSRYRKTG